MPTFPIVTKIVVPPRSSDVLHRERLLDFIHENIDRKLILVSAPAGYGKTTLLVEFTHETDLAVCWYTLDSTDRDPRVFVEHLLASLEHRFPGFGQQTRPVLEAGAPLSSGAIEAVGTLVNEMVERIPGWFVLVLDDFQQIENAPDSAGIMTTLLTYQPEHCHIIMASRTVPGTLPFISLAARGEVAGLGHDDLRFTVEEIRELFQQQQQVQMSLQEAERLASESEGWITAIVLTSHTPGRGMLDIWAQARASGEPLYDYLAGEVLNRQDPELRAFLLTSSTLEEMNPRSCSEALGLRGAEDWLSQLERRNLFVVRLGQERDHFRYHALFREFLQTQLARQAPARFADLHRQAAVWFEKEGQAEKAAEHYLTAGESAEAARVMDQAAQPLLRAGRLETVINWAERLPGEVLRSQPRLALAAAGAASRAGRSERVMEWLDLAEATLRERGDSDLLALGLAAQALVRHNQGRYIEGIRLAQEALSLIPLARAEGSEAAAEAHRVQGICLMRLGQFDDARQHLQIALEGSRRVGDVHREVLTQAGLAACLHSQGQFEEAIQAQRAVVATCRRLGSPGYLAEALNDLACNLYLLGHYGEALAALGEALETAQRVGHQSVEAFVLVSRGEILRDLGDTEGAIRDLTRGLEIAGDLGHTFLAAYGREALALSYLRLGDTEGALDLAQEAVSLGERQGAGGQSGRYLATLGVIQSEAGEVQQGAQTLEEGLALLMESGTEQDIARAQLLLARVLHQAGQSETAFEMLDRALAPYLDAGHGHRLYVEGHFATPLLEDAAAQGIGGRDLAAVLQKVGHFRAAARRALRQQEAMRPPSPPSLRVYGLGVGRTEKDSVPVPPSEWRTATARYLLFYLLSHPPRTREQIGADLWPDLRPTRLAGTFHNTKYRMQRALGMRPVQYEEGLYSISGELDIWYDVAEFERLLDRARRVPPPKAARCMRQAIALYRGDFLEDCYAEWCVARREALRRQYLEAVGKLADWLLRRHRPDEAIPLLREGLKTDTLREDFHRQLMRAHALNGQSEEAIAQYRRCTRTLKRELGVEPEAETAELARAIRKGLFPPGDH
jgi:LuxR family maltose regulon positive regulatory protein